MRDADRLRRIARVLAWVSLALGAVAMVAAVIKGGGYAPALAGLAVGLAVLTITRQPDER